MSGERKELREIARHLLESAQVEVVIGYTAGPTRFQAAPFFARRPEQAAYLIFDRTCEFNLCKFLHRFKGRKVAIVVKGCDERSVIGLIQERQIKREDVILLGAPCSGIVDPEAAAQTDGEPPFYSMCRICSVHNPRFADYLIADPVEQPPAPEFAPEMENLAESSINRRWAAFRKEMSKCILCMACRNLCPACYCTVCFADASQPKWMGKTDDLSDIMFFHLGRFLHLAGRCTGCGACERGCPMNVNLRLYNDRVRKDVKELFGFEAGVDPQAESPMACFRADDPNNFIM